jgi:RNA polymerase sigma-70 factor (ECF subfamily)
MKSLSILTDEELITRFKETDDSVAFSTLAERYQSHIYHKCYSYVHNQDTAEDLRQEVLIKLYLQIKNFRVQAKFSTWLFSIIHNACIDYLRKSKKNISAVITNKLANELPDLIEDEDEIPREISVKLLNELLEQISPDDKMILLMKYKEKYHIKDIQLALGVSESAIKMRLKRAREKVYKLYQKYGN